MHLKVSWLLLSLAVLVKVNAYTNDVEDEDVSVEDTSHRKSPFYDTNIDADTDTLHKEEKPTISEDAIFLPHESYCQYFYAFDGKDSYLYRCASGHRFDSENLQCVKTKNANCGKRKKNPGSSEENKISLTIKCSKFSGLTPHKHYCHLFYNCQYKKGTLFMCPPGKMFDTRTNLCLIQDRVKCDKRENPYVNDDLDDVDKPDTESDVAYHCPESAGVFPDQQYCNKFIRCWYGIGQTYVCPKGKLYDEDLGKCKNRNSVYCNKRIDPDAVEDEEEPELVDENPHFFCFYYKGRYVHKDCRYFYQCENFFGKLYACPQGKLFDPKSQSCKVDSEVDCNNRDTDGGNQEDEFVCPVREGTFKDEDNCGSYYKCKNGKAQRLQCPEGELFDTDWKSCNDENDVVCHDRLLPGDEEEDEENVIDENSKYKCEKPHGRFTHKEYCNWFYHCKDGKSSIRACKKGRYYDGHRSRCYDEVDCGTRVPKEDYEITTSKPREFVCPAKSGKFAHPRLCNAYYVCEKSKPKRHDCPKEKLFHDKWGSCVEESQVSCGDRVHPDVYEEDGESRIIDENPKYECKVVHGNFENDEYCDWFYSCRDKKASLRECRKGKHYDSKSRRCQEEKIVSCGRRRRPEDRETSTTEKGITTREPEFRCRESHGKYPHPRDCSKFYECDKKYNHKEHKCPKKKLFDAKRKSCEDEDHVMCDDRIHPDIYEEVGESRIIDENPKYECKVVHGNFENDEYCDWFYSCRDKKASLRECRKGKHYDSKSRRCQEEKTVSCGRRRRPEDRETSTTETSITTREPAFLCPEPRGKYPHPRDCSKFYECDKKYNHKEHKCPKKKLFDAKRKSCEDEDHVMCDDRIHPDMDPDEPEDVVVDDNPKYTCKNNYGRFTHNEFCHWYYNCHNKKSSVRECKRGKYYDTKRKKCYDNKDVACDERKKPKDDDYRTTAEQRTTQGITESTSERPATDTRTSSTNENDISSSYVSTVSTEVTSTSAEITPTTTNDITTSTDVTTIATPSPTVEEGTTQGIKESTSERPATETRTSGTNENDISSSYVSTVSTEVTSTSTEITTTTTDVITTATNVTTVATPSPTVEEDDNPDKIVDPNPSFSCEEDEGSFAHASYCHYYYSCKNNKATLRECPEGKYFDIERGSCEDWYLVSCGERLTPEEIGSTFDDFQSTPYIERQSTTSRPGTSTSKEPVSEPTYICPTSDGVYPHERNCGRFYECINNNVEVKVCPEGQLYNIDKKSCYEEQETNCGKRIHPNDDPDNPNRIPDKVVDPNPEFNCTDRHGCFTHERLCKWYYYCHDKRPEVRECSGDKYFDSVRNKCLEWWMVFCGNRTTDDEITSIPTTVTSISSTIAEGKSTGTTPTDKGTGSTYISTEISNITTKSDKETDSTERNTKIPTDSGKSTKGTDTTESISTDGSTEQNTKISTDSGKRTKETDTTESISTAGTTEGNTKISTDSDKRTKETDATESIFTGGSTEGNTKISTDSGRRTKETDTTESIFTGGSTEGSTKISTDSGKRTKETDTTESIFTGGSTYDRTTNTIVSDSGEDNSSTAFRPRTTLEPGDKTKNTDTTDNSAGTESTDIGTEGTKVTGSDEETRSTEGRSRTTPDTESKTKTSTKSSLGTGTPGDRTGGTDITDGGKETGSTIRTKNTPTPDPVTKSISTTESTLSSRSTEDKREKTKVTKNDEETSSTTGRSRSTPKSDKTTKSTESTESTLRTGSTDTVQGSTRITSSDKETRTTKEKNKSTTESGKRTKSTPDENLSTRSTEEKTGTTAITDNSKRTSLTTEHTLGPNITDITTETTRISGRDKSTKESGTRTKTTVTTESSFFTGSTDSKTGKETYTTGREGTVSTKGETTTTTPTKSTDTTKSDSSSPSTDDRESGRTGATDVSNKEVGSTSYRPSTTPEFGKETKNDVRTESTLSTGSPDVGTEITSTDRQISSTRVKNVSTPEPGRQTKTVQTTESNFDTRSTDSITGRTEITDRNKETDSTAERLRSTDDSESTTSLVTTDRPITDKCKEEDGDFHHPEDCKKYFTCKDGEYSVNECGDGTLFDVQMRICYREDLVDCGNRTKPEVTTDDCDEWLRTSTTSPDGHTSPSPTKGTTGPEDEGTGGTETTGKTSNTKEVTVDKPSTSSDTVSETTKTDSTKSDETSSTENNKSTESNTPSSSSGTVSENPKDFTKSDGTSSTESDKSTENNKFSTSSDSVSEYTKDDSTKFEKLISTEEDETTYSSTVDTNVTEIIEKETNITDITESTLNPATDNSSDSTNSHLTTENDRFRTENTRSPNTRGEEISTSQGTSKTTDKNTDGYTPSGSTIVTNTTTDSSNTNEEPGENTSSTKDRTTSSAEPSSTKDSEETTTYFTTENYTSTGNTVTNEQPSPSTTTVTGENTELTKNPSESSPTPDDEMTKFTSSTGNDFSKKSTMEKRESTPNTSTDSENTGLTDDQTSPSGDDASTTGEETTKTTLTSGDGSSDGSTITEPTNNPSTKPGKDTDLTDGSSNPSDVTSTIENKTEHTVEPSSSDIRSTPDTTDSTQEITTTEDTNSTKTSTSPDGRNKTPTSEDKTESVRTTEDITDASNTPDVSLQTQVITETKPDSRTTPTDDKTSDTSLTSSVDPRSTKFTTATNDISEITHEHTTMHPCLTHTHSTPSLPTSPPKIDCDENDIDCIQRKAGDINKWFTCPEKQGYFPHPYSKRLFIRCNNGKPRTKKCGKYLVFSVKYMRCIHED